MSNTKQPPEEVSFWVPPAEIWKALEESLKLQSHYATLLNTCDGGKRTTFASVDAWIQRLRELERSGS